VPASFRTFIAIEIPREIRAHVVAHIARLREALPDVSASWIRDQNLHLTLKFLGDVSTDQIEELSHAVANTTSQFDSFQISVTGCGAFPARGKPSVLWIGIKDSSGALSQLQRELEEQCAKVGFTREARAFHPHLTIARLRKPHGGRELAELHRNLEFPALSLTITEVVGFRSELLSQGGRHSALFRHELGRR
jgi:RNA 2',3'-cyclic 3'-phosphodiesterase